jgi:hypothetical protein
VRDGAVGEQLSVARHLVRVELSFVSEDDPGPVGERIRESISLIVGRDRLEEFRVRTMPLDPPARGHLRPVDPPEE